MGQQRATYTDIRTGKAARRLIWSLGGISYKNPPTADSFYVQDGRKFLRSRSWEGMTSRQKQRRRTWYWAIYENVDYVETEEGEYDVFSWHTPVGSVVGRRRENHFVEYPVKSVGDLDVWIHVHQNLHFRPNETWFEKNDAEKLTTLSLAWSPVQQLLQFDIGLSNFYYFLMDAPEKMAALLEVMNLSVTTDAKPDIPYDDVMVLFEALESMVW